MPSRPSDHQRAPRRLATIHPINAHGAAGRTSRPLPEDGDDSAHPSRSDEPRLVLSVDDAAYLLDISRGLVYELVARGELPGIRLGRRIVIPRVALEELLGTVIR